jgi:hypothetical protein
MHNVTGFRSAGWWRFPDGIPRTRQIAVRTDVWRRPSGLGGGTHCAVAAWESSDHITGGQKTKRATANMATAGWASVLHQPSVAKDLVSRFHKDVFPGDK